MTGEAPLDAAFGEIIVEAKQRGSRVAGSGLLPQPHQRVLHQRQLVGVGAHVVDDPRNKARLDLAFEHLRWPFDRCGDLLTGEARAQILRVSDRLGQSLELGATAEEVRAHRQHDIDRYAALVCACQEQRDKGLGLLAAGEALVAEQLLELVDQDQQVAAIGQRPFAQLFDQRQRPSLEPGTSQRDTVWGAGPAERLEQRCGKLGHRVAARA